VTLAHYRTHQVGQAYRHPGAAVPQILDEYEIPCEAFRS
jgi:hypothetical protein